MRALVTGAAGFVGQWLCRELLGGGWDVTGTLASDTAPDTVSTPELRDGVRWVSADVRRSDQLAHAVDVAVPDAIFHLAGLAFLPAAGADAGGTLEVNTVAAARLLAEVRERRRAGTLDPVVLVIGSGEQYGRHDSADMPLSERAEQRPLNVYAASKAAQEVVALEAWRSDGVRVIATRSFNHSGAGQADRFLLPSLVRRALALRRSGGALRLGNTSPVRDFLHVVDVVRAYVALVERGTPGEAYNVSSGVGIDVAALAARVLELTGADASLETDPALVRPVEVPVLVGDPGKLRLATGWAATRSIDSLIGDLIRAETH